jgi:predicted  nucleic acid-binding Zn-ribbon protein
MTDQQRISALERELQGVQSELADLKLAISKLTSRSASRESVQDAVDDLQNSVQLIFKHIRVPGVTYRPGRKISID